MREVNTRVTNRGVRLEDNWRQWSVKSLVCVDDTVLMAESQEGLEKLVTEFAGVCGRRKLKVNVSKSKVMAVSKDGGYKVDICLHEVKMEQVKCFRYLGTNIHKNGRMEEEIGHEQEKGRGWEVP